MTRKRRKPPCQRLSRGGLAADVRDLETRMRGAQAQQLAAAEAAHADDADACLLAPTLLIRHDEVFTPRT
jgi:hypothetical protein